MCNKCSGSCNSCECTCKKYNPCEDPCKEQNCGCDFLVPTDCVVTEENYPCIGTEKGAKLKEVLYKVNEKLCDKTDAVDGIDGDSAYQVWINLGNEGSEQDFIDSLQGVCECNEEVFLQEIDKIPEPEIGTWDGIAIGTEVGIIPTGFSYTVPVGGGGLYDVEYQCTVSGAIQSTNVFIAGIFIDNVPTSSGRTLATTLRDTIKVFQNMHLFKSSLTVADGETIQLKVARLSEKGEFLQNKFRIIKK